MSQREQALLSITSPDVRRWTSFSPEPYRLQRLSQARILQRGQSTNLDRRSDSRERLDVGAGTGGQVDCRESRPQTAALRLVGDADRLNRFLAILSPERFVTAANGGQVKYPGSRICRFAVWLVRRQAGNG